MTVMMPFTEEPCHFIFSLTYKHRVSYYFHFFVSLYIKFRPGTLGCIMLGFHAHASDTDAISTFYFYFGKSVTGFDHSLLYFKWFLLKLPLSLLLLVFYTFTFTHSHTQGHTLKNKPAGPESFWHLHTVYRDPCCYIRRGSAELTLTNSEYACHILETASNCSSKVFAYWFYLCTEYK